MLNIETIRAAQDNNLAAISAVVTVIDEIVTRVAGSAARRISPHGGNGYANSREELAQEARVAVWESLPRFTKGDFEAFVGRTAYTALQDAVRAERNPGADKDAVKVFASMMDAADGDPCEAERLVQTVPPTGRRLSADRAYAARMAWQGTLSIDAQTEDSSIADTLAAHDEQREVRPKVGHGAALEALSVLRRYAGVIVPRMTPHEFAANLPALVDALEDAVTVPREADARRYVLDALRILRAAVSTATDGEVAEELMGASDEAYADHAAKHARVNTALDKLSTQQGKALRYSFGIGGSPEFGWGDGSDVEGLADALGTTPGAAKKARTIARREFAGHYIALVASNEAAAMSWAGAAAKMLAPGGRK